MMGTENDGNEMRINLSAQNLNGDNMVMSSISSEILVGSSPAAQPGQ
jgi:hypothetical protein